MEVACPDANQVLAAERGEYVEGISDPTDPKWITEDLIKPKQPEVSNMGNGVFSIDGLMDSQPAPALSIVDQAIYCGCKIITRPPRRVFIALLFRQHQHIKRQLHSQIHLVFLPQHLNHLYQSLS